MEKVREFSVLRFDYNHDIVQVSQTFRNFQTMIPFLNWLYMMIKVNVVNWFS